MKTNQLFRYATFVVFVGLSLHSASMGQQRSSLTPHQLEIAKQQARLASADVEERRDALTRLRSLNHAEASRVAATALNDPLPIVRATAIGSLVGLPPAEAASHLLPLLSDKDEFVRRETAYALGKAKSVSAVPQLSELLLTDKEDSVRGAAAVALGEIGDSAAVVPLSTVLGGDVVVNDRKTKKSRREQNPFVLRSAAWSLGEIRNSAGAPALIKVVGDEKAENDLRREAATALGKIGSSSALPALQAAQLTGDPYLTEAAGQAIRRISKAN
jgi:HEAT repeat protein